jgi:hypothetical protein
MMTITTLPNETIRMADGAWSLTCPRADLPKWHKLYIGLRDRNKPKTGPGPYHQFYADDVAAIEAAMKGVG